MLVGFGVSVCLWQLGFWRCLSFTFDCRLEVRIPPNHHSMKATRSYVGLLIYGVPDDVTGHFVLFPWV